MDELEKVAIDYLNKNKKKFLSEYTNKVKPLAEKIAIFTAGMSGVGKTELGIFFKENNSGILHIDTDNIREFFKPVGYDGQNSNSFQKVASRGFNELFNYALKQKYSIILDSNLSNINLATQNIERLLKRGYNVDIYYLYNYPKVCFEYATRREVVTHRKVPKEVFVKSNINSYNTVLEIKSIFKDSINLHLIDKRDDSFYKDIDNNFIKDKIGEDFES
ncbi:zeta toxin family protein [Poseidonibacter antarcticus]|uniref:zeta toxin family protein n=1 Tax=Poseidonibacter antarcticus TaxID=2478538 RepID=UPI000EF53C56|nr:zeta toxin family protein [Poseidonibacter antarcticus]